MIDEFGNITDRYKHNLIKLCIQVRVPTDCLKILNDFSNPNTKIPGPKNVGKYDRPSVLGCKPVYGILVVLSSNQINIATFVH